MFLNGLKAKSIIRKLHQENAKRSPITVGNTLRSIGIVEGAIEQFDRKKVKDLCLLLDVKKENVHFMSFTPKIAKGDHDVSSLFCGKDIGWKGVFKTPHLKDFGARNVDLLISYYMEDLLALNAVSSLTKSKFRVGLKDDHYQTHDLVLEVKTEATDVFIKELIKYLKILKIR